jgi:hypothetical protein
VVHSIAEKQPVSHLIDSDGSLWLIKPNTIRGVVGCPTGIGGDRIDESRLIVLAETIDGGFAVNDLCLDGNKGVPQRTQEDHEDQDAVVP